MPRRPQNRKLKKSRRYQPEDDTFRDMQSAFDMQHKLDEEHELPDWLVGAD